MANDLVTEPRDCAAFFQRRVLRSTAHWRDYVSGRSANIAALDEKRDQIIRALLFGLELKAAWPTVRVLIETFSAYMERTGHWDAWQAILDQALTVARRLEDAAGLATLSALLARLLQRQSRFKEATAAYRRAIRLARRIGDEYNAARACSNLGYLYVEQGQWRRAEVLCCHALAIFEKLKSDHGRAHTVNHLGILYTRQRRWQLARQYLEQACTRWQSMKDNHGLMRGYINLGLLYLEMKYPLDALHYLEKARRQAELTGEETEIATIFLGMGVACRLNNESAKAEMWAWRAEAIFRRFHNAVGLAQVQGNLGLACLDQEKWQDAEQHLIAALERWRNLANQLGEIRVLGYIVEYQLARNNRQKAAAYLAALEKLIDQKENKSLSHFLQPQLEKYRRSLKVTVQKSSYPTL